MTISTTTVNTYTESSQFQGDVAILTDGSFIVVWTSYGQDNGTTGVYGQMFNALGEKKGEEFKVNSYWLGTQSDPCVVPTDDGGFFVAWESHWYTGANYYNNPISPVVGQKFNASGVKIGNEIMLSANLPGDAVAPKVTNIEDGYIVSSWQVREDEHFTNSQKDGIYFQILDADGATVHQEKSFEVENAWWEHSISGLINGDFVIAWRDVSVKGGYHDILSQRYDSQGNVVGDRIFLATKVPAYNSVDVTGLNNGSYVVIWDEMSNGGTNEFGRLVGQNNQLMGEEFLVNSFTHGDQGLGQVAPLPESGFAVTWIGDGANGPNGLYLQAFSDTGDRIGDEIQVNEGTQTSPPYASLDWRGGEVGAISWNAPTTSSNDVFLSIVNQIDISAEVDDSSLTEDEIAMAEDVWNSVGEVSKNIKTFVDSFNEFYQDQTGQTKAAPFKNGVLNFTFGTAFDDLSHLFSGNWISPVGGSTKFSNLSEALRQSKNFDEFLEYVSHLKVGGVEIDLPFNRFLAGIGYIDTSIKGYKGLLAAAQGEESDAKDFASILLHDLISGELSGVISKSILSKLGLSVVISKGLGAFLIGGPLGLAVSYGVSELLTPIEEHYAIIDGIQDGIQNLLVDWEQISTEGWAAYWSDDAPIVTTSSGLIFGRGGDDELRGQSGNDLIAGQGGNDILDGGGTGEEDALYGGTGDDTYLVDNINDEVIEVFSPRGGTDTVFSSTSFTLPRGVENLELVSREAIEATGNNKGNIIFGNGNANRIEGKSGRDFLYGKRGNDLILLDGDIHNDFLYGGKGIDTLAPSNSKIRFWVELGKGVAGTGIFNPANQEYWDKVKGIENVTGSNKKDQIWGSAKDNFLVGGKGRDIIDGKNGSDTISGGLGADVLNPGLDDDVDVLKFVDIAEIKLGKKSEIVNQFDINVDILDFSSVDANVHQDGNQKFSFNRDVSGFGAAQAFSIWIKDKNNGDFIVFGDVDGDAEQDFKLVLQDSQYSKGYSPAYFDVIFDL